MANALPLLLGAAAVFMLMGKKGGAVQTNVHIVDTGDTEEAFFAKAASFQGGERVVAIFSSVAAHTPNSIGAAIHPYAQANPKVFFVVFAGAGLEVAADWTGLPLELAPPGRLVASVSNPNGTAEATSMIDRVTPENAATELDDLIKWSLETELTAANSVSIGGLRLKSTGATVAGLGSTSRGFATAPTPAPSGAGRGLKGAMPGISSAAISAAVTDGVGRIFGA